ncbi:MAG: hypothetical protein SOR31_03505 [Parvimonas sp.]|uniref:hypothetical protein n=1 Tax=Parvimonas sp. TaxID=1944660 RepID=UPI002A755BB6|nr:hypothetical protein [Parvimonas sp.]MDY3050683.1 hypothetical protein [Parvimonas sp.]
MEKSFKNFIKKNKIGSIRINSFELDELFSSIFVICEDDKDVIFLEKELKKIITENANERKFFLSKKENDKMY